jgi:hypothetical protein
MAIYDFNSDTSIRPSTLQNVSFGLPRQASLSQTSDSQGGRKPLTGSEYTNFPGYVQEYLIPGFRSLDEAVKQYWTGIRVPTKDAYRFMRVKIAGGNKSILIWKGDLKDGRTKLPVASISRTGHEFFKEKFSPSYLSMGHRYLNTDGSLAAKQFRPVPYMVNYEMGVWAEHKRDAEYILYQVLTRFNPLAELRMYDGKIVGNVQMKLTSSSDSSDKEIANDSNAKVKYDYAFSCEAWLPLPEVVVPTVLGSVRVISETSGQILG